MANFIPFEKLEVGKTYYMQSRYWRKVLGRATVTAIDIFRGTGEVDTDWNPNTETGRGHCWINANEDWMWDAMPTEDEQRKQIEDSWREVYAPPREYEGVVYEGRGLPDDWKTKLDELAVKMTETGQTDSRFKAGRDGKFFIWESKLRYDVSSMLMRHNGECDWDSIRYLESKGFSIHAGERDGFGWLTGIVELPGTNRRILYG